jgi:hypothetical protein
VVVELYDLSGREVALVADRQMEEGHQTFTVNGSLLPAGVYVCTVKNGANMLMKKVIKNE